MKYLKLFEELIKEDEDFLMIKDIFLEYVDDYDLEYKEFVDIDYFDIGIFYTFKDASSISYYGYRWRVCIEVFYNDIGPGPEDMVVHQDDTDEKFKYKKKYESLLKKMDNLILRLKSVGYYTKLSQHYARFCLYIAYSDKVGLQHELSSNINEAKSEEFVEEKLTSEFIEIVTDVLESHKIFDVKDFNSEINSKYFDIKELVDDANIDLIDIGCEMVISRDTKLSMYGLQPTWVTISISQKEELMHPLVKTKEKEKYNSIIEGFFKRTSSILGKHVFSLSHHFGIILFDIHDINYYSVYVNRIQISTNSINLMLLKSNLYDEMNSRVRKLGYYLSFSYSSGSMSIGMTSLRGKKRFPSEI